MRAALYAPWRSPFRAKARACPGELLEQRAGEGGFGYDPLFRYHTGKTFAEMTEKEKNAVSHRAVAAEKMRGVLVEAL